MQMRSFLLVLSIVACACSSSGGDAPVEPVDSSVDSAVDTYVPPADTGRAETIIPSGRVLLLRTYYPDKRCFDAPTEIGNYDEIDDAGVAHCEMGEVCYVRKDGVLAYYDKDCIHGANFAANWDRQDYSDLGPCEPLKHLEMGVIKDCPMTSCTFGRDIVYDAAKGCATSLFTKGCAATKPTSCACDGAGKVFLAADASSTAPSGFTACDATNADCKKALDAFDTISGCATSSSDAGTDG
jgi:hypothetical protein